MLFGIIPNNNNKIKCKTSDGFFIKLRMANPGPILVTADNYAVGKLSRSGNIYILHGMYKRDYGSYIRVKVHIDDGHSQVMEPREVHTFPEYYEFRVPVERVRHDRRYQNPRST